ncbi:hypothetical protein K2Z84_24785 [Candidatus Binatia bacterium]|nr:hypothetical protein [Candidatus Binatia bacterium]
MRLPNGEGALVDPAKVRDYLLSPEHPVGRFKAAFFARIGYGRDDWGRLASDLLKIAKTGDATPGSGNQFGRKYEVRGTLLGGGHRAVEVITVWIVLANETTPRFVTAYPR